MTGHISGPGPIGAKVATAGSFELSGANKPPQTVFLDSASELASHTLSVGDRITVDGVPRFVPGVQAETLYRQQVQVPGLDATRVMRGCWPQLRWLLPSISLLALGSILGAATRPHWIHPRWLVVERTAKEMTCPPETIRETRIGPDGVLHRCRHRAARLKGPYTLWNWDGRLVERGEPHAAGYRVIRTEVIQHGMERSVTLVDGRRHGKTVVSEYLAGRAPQTRYRVDYHHGRKDGIERGWYADGTRAFERDFSLGKARGVWTYFDRQGHAVARGNPLKDPWRFNDAAGQRCLGPRRAADDWLEDRFLGRKDPDFSPCELRCATSWWFATQCGHGYGSVPQRVGSNDQHSDVMNLLAIDQATIPVDSSNLITL